MRLTIDDYTAHIVSVAICSRHAITQTQHRVIIIGHTQTIHHDGYILLTGKVSYGGHKLLDENSLAIHPETCKTIAMQLEESLDDALARF